MYTLPTVCVEKGAVYFLSVRMYLLHSSQNPQARHWAQVDRDEFLATGAQVMRGYMELAKDGAVLEPRNMTYWAQRPAGYTHAGLG